MMRRRGGARALVMVLVVAAFGCSKNEPPRAAQPAPAQARLEDALGDRPSLVLVLTPRALLADRVYGPLLRRASVLAAARAGVSTLGDTALAALERSDEAVVVLGPAGGDPRADDAVVALRGAPADLDPATLIDPGGRPLWRRAGAVGRDVTELVSTEAPDKASLFVLPERTWVIAVEHAVARTREAFARARRSSLPRIDLEEGELLRFDLPGEVLRVADDRLEYGALAPVGRSLESASVSLTSGTQGVLLIRLRYPDEPVAEHAQDRAQRVVDAFRRQITDKHTADSWSWLGASGVFREGRLVTVRAPIPMSWLKALAKADVPADGPL